jgi:hypothetical protein
MANLLLVGDARADERGANWIRQSSVVSTSRPSLKPPSTWRQASQIGSQQDSFSPMSSRSHLYRPPPSVDGRAELRLHR